MKHLFAVLVLASAKAAFGSPLVQPLKPQDEVQGCGCSFHVPVEARDEGTLIMQWELGELARMRVDGKLELLRVGRGGDELMNYKAARVGERREVHLRSDRAAVLATCIVSESCYGSEGGCEVVSYRARLEITLPLGKTQVNAWASCGC